MRVSSAALRRAAVLVAVGLAVAVTCTLLGRWQWHRHVVRDALIATVEANWAAPAVPLASLVPAVDDEPRAADEWRSVAVTGHYLAGSAVLLRNRPVNGTPAYHVLVPFQVDGSDGDGAADGGTVLVVDRGWVPVGNDAQAADDVPAPPPGSVELVVRLRMPEAPSDRSAPAGQVQAIDPAQVLAAGGVSAGATAYRWYAGLASESPAPATALGTLASPSTDPGPHLSYAVQWWVFAVAGLAALGWMARREIVDDLAGRVPVRAAPAGESSGAGSSGTARPAPVVPPGGLPLPDEPLAPPSGGTMRPPIPRPPRRPRGRDELAEDALLDAQLREPR